MGSRSAELEDVLSRAEKRVALLSREFARAAPGERERTLAALECERWLADGCRSILPRRR